MFEHEKLICSKLDKSGRNKLLWQNQEEMKNLNRPIMSKDVIKIPNTEYSRITEFTDKIYQRINFNLLMFLKNWKRGQTLQNQFYVSQNYSWYKSQRNILKENKTILISLMNTDAENFKKNISKPKSRTYLKVYIKWQ